MSRRECAEIFADYRLPRITAVRDLPPGSAYIVDTVKGKYVIEFEVPRSEMDVKRELELALFLRKHGFPCVVPLADCRGRYYRERGGMVLSIRRVVGGDFLEAAELTLGQLESVGRVMADLHLLSKAYKKGVEAPYSYEHVADLFARARVRLPAYFKRPLRLLDEELEYLGRYLETKLPKGIIHGNLTAENLKLKGDKVVAVYGFEGSARGKFILDLANAVNTLCFEAGRYAPKKFDALVAGYEGLRSLSLAEWDAFPNELRFSAFRLAASSLVEFFLAPADRERINKEFQGYYDRLLILRRERDGGLEPMLMTMATGYDYRKYQRVRAVEKQSSH